MCLICCETVYTYNTSVHDGKSLGTSSSSCLLQSTRVPRHEHLVGQAKDCEHDNVLNKDSHTLRNNKNSTFLKRSRLVSLGKDPILEKYFQFTLKNPSEFKHRCFT